MNYEEEENMADESCSSLNKVNLHNVSNKKQRFKSDSDYVLKKRCPPRSTKRKNDIYVTNKSNFQSQLDQCEKLIESGENEIVLHGLGAAVPRTINLALQLFEKLHGTFQLHTETGTVNLVDDYEPITDYAEPDSQPRQNSAIHIRVVRTALFGAQ